MIGTPSRLVELLAECKTLGIRLSAAEGGGLEIDAPQDALTPNLLDRLKACKADLLAILRRDPEAREEQLAIALEACGLDPAEEIDPADLIPCPTCGRLELWETLSGTWRCLRCDPPTKARRLAETAEHIRRRAKQRNIAGQKG